LLIYFKTLHFYQALLLSGIWGNLKKSYSDIVVCYNNNNSNKSTLDRKNLMRSTIRCTCSGCNTDENILQLFSSPFASYAETAANVWPKCALMALFFRTFNFISDGLFWKFISPDGRNQLHLLARAITSATTHALFTTMQEDFVWYGAHRARLYICK
jgi:hypothetical protein